MQNKTIDGLRNRRSQLVRYIHLCNRYKSSVVQKLKDVSRLYAYKEVGYGQYKEYESKAKKWIGYYDNLIVGYEARIREITSEIKEVQKQRGAAKRSAITIGVIALIFMMSWLFVYFNVPARITGMAVSDTIANVTVENVAPNVTNVNITPSTPYTTDNLSCLGTTADANLDNVTKFYKWYLNDELNSSYNNQQNISSDNTTSGQQWICEITPFDGLVNGTPVNSSAVTIQNTVPTLDLVELYPVAPYTTDNLTLNVTCSDVDSQDTITAYWDIYRDGSLIAEFNDSQVVANGVEMNFTVVNSTNTTKGETWIAEVWCGDGADNTSKQNSSSRLIQNSLPSIPTLISPNDDNNTLFDRNVAFNWTNSSDNDDDTISYELNITNPVYADAFKSTINNSNHTLSEILETDSWYNWTVRAYDGEDYSNWSSIWDFYIPSSVIINLTNDTTSFGSVYNNESKNTTSGAEPIVVENIGNVLTDIKVMAQDGLWDSVALNTSYFQFMAGNSSEVNSFTWASSQITWENMTNVSTSVLDSLKYNVSRNLGEIESQILVPEYEASGIKSSTIIVTGVMS
jgi:hypothetical protein